MDLLTALASIATIAALALGILQYRQGEVAAAQKARVAYDTRRSSVRVAPHSNILRRLRGPQPDDQLTCRPIDTVAELRELWAVDEEAYGEQNIPFDLFESWWHVFPEGLCALLEGDKVKGAIGLWPVTPLWYAAFKWGLLRERSLTASTIRKASKTPCRHWYVSGIVITDDLRRTYAVASLIVRRTMRFATDERVEFPARLAAMAYSRDGEALLRRHLGASLVALSSRTRDRHPIYELTLGTKMDAINNGLGLFDIRPVESKRWGDFESIVSELEPDLGPEFRRSMMNWCGQGERPYPLAYWRVFLFMTKEDTPVAIGGLYRQDSDPPDQFWIGWLGVRPNWRRKGIGSVILSYLEQQAGLERATALQVYAAQTETAFYLRAAYEQTQTSVASLQQAGAEADDVVLRKKL
jgi:GNAT superfamily N-acetyltransferase